MKDIGAALKEPPAQMKEPPAGQTRIAQVFRRGRTDYTAAQMKCPVRSFHAQTAPLGRRAGFTGSPMSLFIGEPVLKE
jgi:hypothetical protein